MGARSVMARAWICLCRLLLFLIFLLPPPAAPGHPAGECAGPGRACRPHRPRPPIPFPGQRRSPFPGPSGGSGPPLSPLPGAIWGGSGSRCPCPALEGRPVGQRPSPWLGQGRGSCPLSRGVPGVSRGVPAVAGASRRACGWRPLPACCCRGCCGGLLCAPWHPRGRAGPGSDLGSLPCHTCPCPQVSCQLSAPPSSRGGYGSARLLGSRRQSPPAKPPEMQGCLGHGGALEWVRTARDAVPREAGQDSGPSFCMAFEEMVPCCP